MAAVKKNQKGKQSNAQTHAKRIGHAIETTNGETVLTPDLEKRLCDMIKAGCYQEKAALSCGIAVSTFYRWLQLGARGDERFTGLAESVEKAKASAQNRFAMIISKAAEEQWQAAAWWLERTDHKNWGRKDHTTLANDPDAPIKTVVVKWGKDGGEVEF